MTVITFEVIVPALTFLLALWAVSTQIIVPIMGGTRLFPVFRKQYLDLVDELNDVEAEIEADHLKQHIAAKRQELKHEV